MKQRCLAIVLVATFAITVMGQHRSASRSEDGAPFPRTGCPDFTDQQLYYYAGDFDSYYQEESAVSNEADTQISTGSQIYQAFQAKGTRTKPDLRITGLCVNSVDSNGQVIDNPTPYEVRVGAKVGSGGQLVCRGTAISTDTYTGNVGGLEYAHEVKFSKCKVSAPTKGIYYWVNLQPQCFKDTGCPYQRYLNDSNDENINHIGHVTPPGMALWNSTYYGKNWVNPNSVFGSKKGLSFSQGVAGKLER